MGDNMLKIYNTDIETNKFEEIREFKKGSWINLVNPTEEEIKKKFVKLVDTTPLSEFSSSDEYLLLLSYDPETDVYFVLCGGYGSPVVKDNKVYNSVKDEYVDMARIEAAAQTELEFAIK